MNYIFKNRKYNKAFGLVESLIALIFVASTMILAIKTVAKGLQVSKQNEIRDQATGIMLRGLEYNQLDLPYQIVQTFIDNEPLGPEQICFVLDYSHDHNPLYPVSVNCSPYKGTVMECENDSQYKLNIDGVHVCNRLMFTNVAANQLDESSPVLMSDKIRINSTVAYYIEKELIVESVDTYRKIR